MTRRGSLVGPDGSPLKGGAILAHPERNIAPPGGVAIDDAIYHLDNPRLPQFRFEYHARNRVLFLIRKGVKVDGQEIARNIAELPDASTARYVVAAWCMGYRQCGLDATRTDLGQSEIGETEGKA